MPLDSLIQTIHQVVKQPSLSQVITVLIILCVKDVSRMTLWGWGKVFYNY